ncbi:maltase alpha-glucosidase Mal1 [Schizosaccharomyces cryophilus OY26]|uniref:Maltase alpha-glucosidase Mal1 n=1 Tax=Schizosaccharomyces cryophilus (strain OY26 / ATCC MYA-4695 / CBS 11777 / NBRC 106824 / NRRL Y48691) TaxID=653667 RepID=S9XEL7_SCHCR|nr:maltase alpha-glucosidase Mal1 [Schizosaccharomyces cryophilus OY26]EPY52236.1 maltase alpha-glucosidase Mal1 [Schizosaccharomyces cryophilus OY26]
MGCKSNELSKLRCIHFQAAPVMKVVPSDKIKPTWWRETSVYQIYPASFKDSNDDGFGDLGGIISKVDYLKSLNVESVWLSPIYPSPLKDMGYDVSDYKQIDSRYGSLKDLDTLMKALHERDMKLVMDLVLNHTSDQHEWFKESRSSKKNPKRDWYVWKPAKYNEKGERSPPNNWSSYFDTSAWEWDEATQEYYLHLFAVEQPDLNWENPSLREAIHDILKFWLDRGVDGFRLDVINMISKDQEFPDAPITDSQYEYQLGYQYYANGPRIHEYLSGLGNILEKYNAFSVGEMPHVTDTKEVLRVVAADRKELTMIFQFDLVQLDSEPGKDNYAEGTWKLSDLKKSLKKWQSVLLSGGGWNASFIENHDQPRAVSRYLSDSPKYRSYSSKLMALFIIFQSGTPFVFQGQELGLASIPRDWPIDEYHDVETQNSWKLFMSNNPTKEEVEKKMNIINKRARDNGRTPMHWDSSPNSGFTKAGIKPWMRITDDYKEWNADIQINDPESPYTFWSKALKLRKELKGAVVYGSFELVSEDNPFIVAFVRESASYKLFVVLNFTENTVSYDCPFNLTSSEILLDNYHNFACINSSVLLNPYQAVLLKL